MQNGRVVKLDSSATLTILVRKVTFSPDFLGEKSHDQLIAVLSQHQREPTMIKRGV